MTSEKVHFLQKIAYHQPRITEDVGELLQKKLKQLLTDLGAEQITVRTFPSHFHVFSVVEDSEKVGIFLQVKEKLSSDFADIPWDSHLYLFPISNLSKKYIEDTLTQEHRELA